MKYLITILIVLLPVSVYSEERIVDTLQNVDLIAEDRINEEGERYGVDYYVHNRNEKPIYVSIEAMLKENIYANLPEVQYIIDNKERVYMGWIVQSNGGEGSKWEVEWSVETP